MKARLSGSSCFLALLMAAQPAVARSTEAVDAADARSSAEEPTAAESGTGLKEIVVTAQRRSENLQHAAIAITAVTADTLVSAGVTRPNELTSIVPALQVATSAGPYNLFYLRGVGNFNGNALADAAVAFNYDGVYVGRPSSTTGFFYDLERVEVLKGPQGTLYGRNATGGALNVITKAPELGVLEGNLVGEYGNYDAVRIDGAVNAPLGDNAALRAAGIFVRHDGYLSDGTDDQKDYGGRLSFRWEPSDDFKLALYGDYFHQGGIGPGSSAVALGLDRRLGLMSPENQAYYQTQQVAIAGRNFAPVTSTPFLDSEYWGVHAVAEWKTPAGTITVIPAYRGSNVKFNSVSPGFQISQREKDSQYSTEFRLSSSDDHKIRYMFGAFYYNETSDVPEYIVNSQFNVAFQRYSLNTQSMAVFGRLAYAITDDFRITAGGRYTTEDKSFKGDLLGINKLCLPIAVATCPNATPFPYEMRTRPSLVRVGNASIPQFDPIGGTLLVGNFIDADERASFERFTWRLGFDWDITPRNLFYASYETGFKSGGFFFSSDDGVYKPESISAWTVGSKNRFFSNRLQLNLEAFLWKYKHQQISHLGTDSAGTIIFPTENIGSATYKGVEVETQFLVTENTLLSADVQYLDAKYDRFVYNVPNQGPPFTGCPSSGLATPAVTIDCSGFRPPYAPEWTINLGAQQTIPLANEGKIVLNGRTHYQSRTLSSLEFLPEEYQEGYWTVDGSVTYSAPGDRYFLTAYINNATDKTVLGNAYPPPLGHFVVGSVRPPRTYGIRAGLKF